MRILFKHALFLPCADAQPQADMCVGVSNGVVAFVGAQPPEGFDPDRQIDCHGALLMPGLVNAHTPLPSEPSPVRRRGIAPPELAGAGNLAL